MTKSEWRTKADGMYLAKMHIRDGGSYWDAQVIMRSSSYPWTVSRKEWDELKKFFDKNHKDD